MSWYAMECYVMREPRMVAPDKFPNQQSMTFRPIPRVAWDGRCWVLIAIDVAENSPAKAATLFLKFCPKNRPLNVIEGVAMSYDSMISNQGEKAVFRQMHPAVMKHYGVDDN